MNNATPTPQPPQRCELQPFAIWNPTRGIWETMQPDLSGLMEPFSAIWSTRGETHNGSAYRLRLSAFLTAASASSSSPIPKTLFRTPLAPDSSRGGETLERLRARRGTIALSHQIINLALHGPDGSTNKHHESETLWSLIEGIFTLGTLRRRHRPLGTHHRPRRPTPALLSDNTGPRPSPEFVEWLMGLPAGWVTDLAHGLTPNQQIAALGNGVLPLHAATAFDLLR